MSDEDREEQVDAEDEIEVWKAKALSYAVRLLGDS